MSRLEELRAREKALEQELVMVRQQIVDARKEAFAAKYDVGPGTRVRRDGKLYQVSVTRPGGFADLPGPPICYGYLVKKDGTLGKKEHYLGSKWEVVEKD